MTSNLERYKKDLESLIESGEVLSEVLKGENENLFKFREEYEIWYSEALYLVRAIMPDRLDDFKNYYENKKEDGLKKAITYTPPRSEGISIEFEYRPAKKIDFAKSLFVNQLNIIKSCQRRFESSLFNIKQLVQADLFDSELETAEELNKKGFYRAAGAVAGVVLEKHLFQVCASHKIKISKKAPSINDYNQSLKDNDVIEIKEWRFIQRMADLRNLCDHNKENEPRQSDIEELIVGIEKISKIVF
jgi:hypothetical protein